MATNISTRQDMHRLLIGLILCIPAVASAQRPQPAAGDSVSHLVQRFYDWYVPRAAKPGKRDMIMEAATRGPLAFDSTLVRWLRIDSTARGRAVGEIDGLDSDPYLNAQDPCDRYTVHSARPSAQTVRVSVVGHGGCGAHRDPDVIVELSRRAGQWIVLDFLNPRQRDERLLTVLRQLHPKTEETNPASRGGHLTDAAPDKGAEDCAGFARALI